MSIVLELPLDYKHNKRLDWFLTSAIQAEVELKEGDTLSILCDDVVNQWRLPLHGEHTFPWYKKTDYNKCRPDLKDWSYE